MSGKLLQALPWGSAALWQKKQAQQQMLSNPFGGGLSFTLLVTYCGEHYWFRGCSLGWFKNPLSSQTEKLMAGTKFSDYLAELPLGFQIRVG